MTVNFVDKKKYAYSNICKPKTRRRKTEKSYLR